MDTLRSRMQRVNTATNKINYSPPASPDAVGNSDNNAHATSSPASGTNLTSSATVFAASSYTTLSTPKKNFLDAVMLQAIREKLKTPGGACELHSLRLDFATTPVHVIKDRYLISSQPIQTSANAAAKTPSSYRHLIDLTSSNLKCTDVFTEEQFLCKVINEPLHKVQRAYFQLQQAGDRCRSSIYGHELIRDVHDIVPLTKQRTYVIIAASQPQVDDGEAVSTEEDGGRVYEDLHTYIRRKRRLREAEACSLFHQICQTVQVCHSSGIILRDLKLKRFYFIDEARTKLQYESLEGSMILDDPADDTLSDKIGCPLYTAPELLCPNPTYRGKPADMWSLGVILYTMLVGQYPFYEKGNCNLITIIRHSNVQIPSMLSKSVRWLLLALLRKNHEYRMRAEHIFYSPWLKNLRPYYMYISVDAIMPDCEDEEEQKQSTTATSEVDESCVQPLDYTCNALQLESGDNDVDMES